MLETPLSFISNFFGPGKRTQSYSSKSVVRSWTFRIYNYTTSVLVQIRLLTWVRYWQHKQSLNRLSLFFCVCVDSLSSEFDTTSRIRLVKFRPTILGSAHLRSQNVTDWSRPVERKILSTIELETWCRYVTKKLELSGCQLNWYHWKGLEKCFKNIYGYTS